MALLCCGGFDVVTVFDCCGFVIGHWRMCESRREKQGMSG